MYIERLLSSELIRLAGQYPAVVLTGPRQVGKTTLLEKTFAGAKYVSLDYAQHAERAESRPEEFLDDLSTPAIIDEIQYAPGLLRHIKTRIDRSPGGKGLYFITGSQSFPVMQGVSESLAGRAAVLALHGLSFQEWRAASDGAPAEYLFRGSYPALWNRKEDPVDRDRWYQSYVATYLERDVRNILRVARLRDFERFLRICASRAGRTLNLSDMARDLGISPSTAREWLGVLEASHQIYLLEPYYESYGKRLAKSPKLYFPDTGLALFLAGYSDAATFFASPQIGAYWENYVVGQWLRWKHWQAPAASLWYWQNQSKQEVDLVVDHNGKLHPIECKWKELPDADDCRGIRSFRSMYPEERVGPAYVACNPSGSFEPQPGILAVSGWEIRPYGMMP